MPCQRSQAVGRGAVACNFSGRAGRCQVAPPPYLHPARPTKPPSGPTSGNFALTAVLGPLSAAKEAPCRCGRSLLPSWPASYWAWPLRSQRVGRRGAGVIVDQRPPARI